MFNIRYSKTSALFLKSTRLVVSGSRNYDFSENGHKYFAGNEEYFYDANGNMKEDKNKNITVEYNYLNLPVRIIFDDNRRIEWTYTASGAKLRKTVYNDGALSYTKDYTGGFVYSNSLLDFFNTQEGRVVNNNGQYEYQYFLKDHLGNVRAAVAGADSGLVHKQVNQYYPFGLELANIGMTTDNDNKFKYNAKELEDDHNLYWYHYGARYYDPQLGMWHTIDPVDEFYSPYIYCSNSPIIRFDPDGMDDIYVNANGVKNTVPTGFWSFDWLFGDNWYIQGSGKAPHEYGGNYYWNFSEQEYNHIMVAGGINGVVENTVVSIGQFAKDKDATFNVNFTIVGEIGAIAEAVTKSPHNADWDFKSNKYEGIYHQGNRKVYILNGKGYALDYIGNVAWGMIMSNAGWRLNEALNAAGWYQIWTGKTKLSWIFFSDGDDPRDQSAIIDGFYPSR